MLANNSPGFWAQSTELGAYAVASLMILETGLSREDHA